MLTVAILGRPNVGKSTLFNRLAGRKQALVHDQPGVTRDWREAEGNLGDLNFRLLDTAGLEQAEKKSLAARMTQQTLRALEQADVALLVVDGQEGITPTDEHFARLLRKSKTKIILVVNKCEGKAARATIHEAYALGLGEPVGISAEHGEGLVELYEALAKLADGGRQLAVKAGSQPPTADRQLIIAIVGRPNAGKSTLMNAILGKERVLTGPEAGITRDAIAEYHEFAGKKIKLVDTAGMRRKSKVVKALEQMSVGDSLQAIRFASVVVLVLDAMSPMDKQDNDIAALVAQEGRAMVIALNKWDLVKEKKSWLKALDHLLMTNLPQMRGITLVPISAEQKTGIGPLLKACVEAEKIWNKKLPTGQLNRWLAEATSRHAPPLIDRRRLKLQYMTQTATRPPTFRIFANLSDVPGHYLRYLENSLREVFRLPGTPIRIRITKKENPYDQK